MVLMSSDIGKTLSLDLYQRKENNNMALQCADKKGLVIQGNGQRYEFNQGDIIPERIFENDFVEDQGFDFCKALIENGRIKEIADEKKSKKDKEGAK